MPGKNVVSLHHVAACVDDVWPPRVILIFASPVHPTFVQTRCSLGGNYLLFFFACLYLFFLRAIAAFAVSFSLCIFYCNRACVVIIIIAFLLTKIDSGSVFFKCLHFFEIWYLFVFFFFFAMCNE